MKLFYIFFILISFSFQIHGQQFKELDKKVKEYPYYSRPISIAQRIDKDFSTDLEKVRALYTWMTTHISYDLKEYYSGKKVYSFTYSSKEELKRGIEKRNNQVINKTLKTKRAVCEGYAQTFKKICDLLSIESEVISGYSKTVSQEIGKLPLGGKHAWNTVKIDNKWKFIDTTWGAGYTNEENRWIPKFDAHYFFTNPKQMIISHYPEKDEWQLIYPSISQKEFADNPIFTTKFFNEKLSLKSPTSGILSARNKNFITIVFEKMSADKEIAYAYEGDYYMKSIIPEFKKGNAVIKIPCKGKKRTTLNILANNEVVLQYKIK